MERGAARFRLLLALRRTMQPREMTRVRSDSVHTNKPSKHPFSSPLAGGCLHVEVGKPEQ